MSVGWRMALRRAGGKEPVAQIEDGTWSNLFLWFVFLSPVGALIIWPMVNCGDLIGPAEPISTSKLPDAGGRMDLKL